MEITIDRILPEMLKSFDNICTCEKCILDIKAIALNNLPPHYIVTNKGELYSKINEMDIQYETDIVKVLVDAIEKVSKNPRHE